jgi:Trypsin-like peptidase domain
MQKLTGIKWLFSVFVALVVSCALAQADFGFPDLGDGDALQTFATHDDPTWEFFADCCFNSDYAAIARSVGMLEMTYESDGAKEVYACTGTIISERFLITNYHCVYPQKKDKKGNTYTLIRARLIMNYLTSSSQTDSYELTLEPKEKSLNLDYAILEFLNNSPVGKYNAIPVNLRDADESDNLFILHHSAGEPLRITRKSCSILSIDLSSDQKVDTPDGNTRLVNPSTDQPHFCDSLGGSSGSLVFERDESEVSIVGLHFSGTDNSSAEGNRFNLFVRIKAIESESPILRNLAVNIEPVVEEPTDEGQLILQTDKHVIKVSETEETIIIKAEAITDFTDTLRGDWPIMDLFVLWVDVNQNAIIDPYIDVHYSYKFSGENIFLCSQYYSSTEDLTPCGEFVSAATVDVWFEESSYNPQPHPIWQYTIPKTEVFSNGSVTFTSYFNSEDGYEFYPPLEGDMFQKILAYPSQKNLIAEDQWVYETGDHVISISQTEDSIIVGAEAINDFTDNLVGEWPLQDYFSLLIDVNQNSLRDPYIDIGYGYYSPEQNPKDKVMCSFYLSKNGTTPCGQFVSTATVNVSFASSPYNSTPHPIWQFIIPKEEIFSSGSFNFTTSFSSEKGTVTYPVLGSDFYNDSFQGGHFFYPAKQ